MLKAYKERGMLKMTIKTFFTTVASAIVNGVKAIGAAIVDAKISSLVKTAIFIGGSIYVAYMIIHYFTSNKKNYDEKKDETPVDRNLCLRYDDPKKFKKMNPLIANDKNLYKAIKKTRNIHQSNPAYQKYKKEYRQKHDKRYLDKQQADIDRLTDRVKHLLFPGGKMPDDVSGDDILDECHSMLHIAKAAEYDDSLRDEGEDNFSLRRIWDSSAY